MSDKKTWDELLALMKNIVQDELRKRGEIRPITGVVTEAPPSLKIKIHEGIILDYNKGHLLVCERLWVDSEFEYEISGGDIAFSKTVVFNPLIPNQLGTTAIPPADPLAVYVSPTGSRALPIRNIDSIDMDTDNLASSGTVKRTNYGIKKDDKVMLVQSSEKMKFFVVDKVV